MTTYTARWVFPVAGPPLERGTVTVAGDRIAAVESHGARSSDADLGNVALIPGLVNAHTHLDLSGARGRIPPTDPAHFTDWLRGVIAYRRSRTPEETQADVRAGLGECLRYGTTLIGDIAAEGASWDALTAAPVRAVVFRELIGLARYRQIESVDAATFWLVSRAPQVTCRPGLSPHSPYSAAHGLIRMVSSLSSIPATVHLAETPGELELLDSQSGPFVPFLQEFRAWNRNGLSPSIDWILWVTRRSPCVLFAHCNYLPADTAFQANQSVVYCPRTHAAFGHSPHPFRDFLARGVRVCLGTDSLASNPDLDVLAEARFVHARYPDFPGDALLRMVTLSGAEALGWADEVGSLESGKSADFVAMPLPDRDEDDPHELLFADDEPDAARRTMFRGAWRAV